MDLPININEETGFLQKERKRRPEAAAYFNIYKKQEFLHFKYQLRKIRKETLLRNQTIVFLCIGSDRATGDCFGPLVGEALLGARGKKHRLTDTPKIYGTLEKPIHAVNLEKTIWQIYKKYPDPYIIAIDASLGVKEHIGFITLGDGPLFPGIGVKKSLPEIGDTAITGIVNISTDKGQNTLQTTRLSIVCRLAGFVSQAIIETFLS